MKKILKYSGSVILTFIILGTVYFFSKWKKIEIDGEIEKSKGINKLNSKFFDHSFLMFDTVQVKTDFRIFEKISDSVTFNFSIKKSSKFENIYYLTFNSGDGYSGVNIDIIKYRNFFSTSAESYTDVVSTFDFMKPAKFVIKKHNLVLNKSRYKKGDSIFGKIELQIEFSPTDSIYNSGGYFRGIIE